LSTADVVLDIGCGTGYLLRQIADSYPGVTGIGIDIAPGMVEEARAKAAAAGSRNLTFVQSDWEHPTREVKALLARQPIAWAICSSAFHYFKRPASATRAIYEVLQPGGTLLILERCGERSALTVVWHYLHQYVLRDGVRFYSSAEIVRLVAAAGFGDVDVLSRLQKMLWRRKLYTSLALVRGIRAPGLDPA
jgi:ubiquinone/menaquinone biosynthesis C-methylase UbiE